MSNIKSFSKEMIKIMPFLLRECVKRESNELSRGQISFPQMVALELAAQNRQVTMSALSKTLSIKHSSTTVLIDRLVQQRLLRREPDRMDRRIVWILATPKGKKVIGQIMRQKQKSLEEIFSVLTATERKQYLSALQKVYRSIEGNQR